jgi:hypothetical protein
MFRFVGDWGLGIGDWGLGIGPNPQSPIPGIGLHVEEVVTGCIVDHEIVRRLARVHLLYLNFVLVIEVICVEVGEAHFCLLKNNKFS